MLTSEDESLVIKPALPLELEFYQKHISNPALEPLHPFLPLFYGTLKLEGNVEESNPENLVVKPLGEAKEHNKDERHWCDWTNSSVLRSCPSFLYSPLYWKICRIRSPSRIFLMSSFLGRYLYDESASSDKRARMEKTARETTSGEAGIRITGFQVRLL